MKIKKKLINEAYLLGNELSHFNEDFEVSDLEAEEMLEEFEEHAEKYQRTKGILKGRATATQVMQRKYGNRFGAAMQKKASLSMRNSKSVKKAIQGAFVNIVVTRLSNNLLASLPVPIFGAIAERSTYSQLLSEFLPAGITVLSIAITTTGGFRINYTDGVVNDSVTIECTQIPYSNFVRALITDQFDVNKVRYSLANAVTMLPQYQEPFQYVKKSIFGTKQVKDFPIEMHKTPMQQQAGILDIDMNFDIDKDTALVCNVANLGAGIFCQFNLNLFITQYFKYNAKSVLS